MPKQKPKAKDEGPDFALMIDAEDEDAEGEDMGEDDDELSGEQLSLAKTMGLDESQAEALKSFIKTCSY